MADETLPSKRSVDAAAGALVAALLTPDPARAPEIEFDRSAFDG